MGDRVLGWGGVGVGWFWPHLIVAAVLLLAFLLVAAWWLMRVTVFGAALTARPFPEPEPEPEPAPVRPEPWRDSYPSAVLFPTGTLVRFADPAELGGARLHRFRVDPLVEQIEADGLREPGVINVDQTGKAVLADGNHRLVAHLEQQWPAMPVVFKHVRMIRGHGVPVRVLLDELLAAKP